MFLVVYFTEYGEIIEKVRSLSVEDAAFSNFGLLGSLRPSTGQGELFSVKTREISMDKSCIMFYEFENILSACLSSYRGSICNWFQQVLVTLPLTCCFIIHGKDIFVSPSESEKGKNSIALSEALKKARMNFIITKSYYTLLLFGIESLSHTLSTILEIHHFPLLDKSIYSASLGYVNEILDSIGSKRGCLVYIPSHSIVAASEGWIGLHPLESRISIYSVCNAFESNDKTRVYMHELPVCLVLSSSSAVTLRLVSFRISPCLCFCSLVGMKMTLLEIGCAVSSIAIPPNLGELAVRRLRSRCCDRLLIRRDSSRLNPDQIGEIYDRKPHSRLKIGEKGGYFHGNYLEILPKSLDQRVLYHAIFYKSTRGMEMFTIKDLNLVDFVRDLELESDFQKHYDDFLSKLYEFIESTVTNCINKVFSDNHEFTLWNFLKNHSSLYCYDKKRVIGKDGLVWGNILRPLLAIPVFNIDRDDQFIWCMKSEKAGRVHIIVTDSCASLGQGIKLINSNLQKVAEHTHLFAR
ncbi:hypothetical protein ADUPG1_008372 [Aduncisulcus paluster]|uniref:Uncharacterized protein n=1 Tax=Aduncisulcus paluster TaxID=2918883 RepID=A0ABQ5KRP8_9EUKA|nr:hypothetical protein ADUPG1_008372 [Aduncisulcus paluster]